MSRRYDKELIEEEALASIENGRMSDIIGQFIMDRAEEISSGVFKPDSQAVHGVLVDNAIMRCCEEFLGRYEEGRSAANLIISMIHSSMLNTVKALNHKDLYGELNKSFMTTVDIEGRLSSNLYQCIKDENISRLLSGENINDLL